MGKHVFVSYSRKDQTYARNLADCIRRAQLEVWMDDDVEHGDSWWPTIVQALRGCSAMIVVMTPEAEKSKWVHREILLAMQEETPIFPVLLRGKGLAILIDVEPARVLENQLPPKKFVERLQRACGKQRNVVPNSSVLSFIHRYSNLASSKKPSESKKEKRGRKHPRLQLGLLGLCFCGSGKSYGECHGRTLAVKATDKSSPPVSLCFCGSGKTFFECHGALTSKASTLNTMGGASCYCGSGKKFNMCHGLFSPIVRSKFVPPTFSKPKEPASPPAPKKPAFGSKFVPPTFFKPKEPVSPPAPKKPVFGSKFVPPTFFKPKEPASPPALKKPAFGSKFVPPIGSLSEQPCFCGSGKTFRECHGRTLKLP